MIELFYQIVLVLFVAVSVLLFCFGMNCYVIIAFFLRRARSTSERQLLETKKWQAEIQDADLPIVTTQIPLYNECNVAERVIRSVAAMDYPAEKHQIQVLDDSNDETADFVDRTAASLRSQGIWIDVFRRPKRRGYKAGALDDAIPKVAGDFIAIFDSDFTPPSDFLRRMLPHFREPQTGIVQARWDHLNQDHSSLTRAQAVGIDGHFLIEQVARSANRLLLNFNGTAGIWRKEAIVDAGGWSADTLTEDLDLSYRAQLISSSVGPRGRFRLQSSCGPKSWSPSCLGL